jgi:hypothetical protein
MFGFCHPVPHDRLESILRHAGACCHGENFNAFQSELLHGRLIASDDRFERRFGLPLRMLRGELGYSVEDK